MKSNRHSVALAGVLVLGAHCATAQEYPAKPVRVVVPNAAGSLNDSLVRVIFPKVSEATGQPFVVENRPLICRSELQLCSVTSERC